MKRGLIYVLSVLETDRSGFSKPLYSTRVSSEELTPRGTDTTRKNFFEEYVFLCIIVH
jgi:hypothetical protein